MSIKEQQHTCKGCGLECKLKSEYESHHMTCVFFNQDFYKKLRQQSENIKDRDEMFQYLKGDFFKTIINHYDKKFEKLEKENQKLKKDISSIKNNLKMKTRKRITDILNNSKYIGPTFNEWLNELTVSESDLECVFDSNLLDGMKTVLLTSISIQTQIPIQAFDEKKNVLYGFIKDKINETVEWKSLEKKEIHQIVFLLTRKFMNKFIEWSNENETKIDNNESLKDKQILGMVKLNGGNKSEDSLINEIKEWLFNRLQTHIDYII
jgi:hypothetical protein